jgi:hypothetical protein
MSAEAQAARSRTRILTAKNVRTFVVGAAKRCVA